MLKKPRGNIYKIREFELEKIHLVDEFDILQIVGEGWFGKILLVEHRASQTEMVLKAVPKPYVSLRDFYREFHYGLHLGIHRNIVTTYDVAFETAGFYVFTQEYAPMGDLTSNVTDTGVGEVYSKRVAKQIASALDYMHSKDIVHRDVKLDNVLIYRSDFTRVKLCDFGESYQAGTTVERRNEWLPYSPPEVLEIKPEGTYKADPSHDVWQFAIVIFVCLTGCLPWQKAASDDPRYVRYLAWHGTIMLPIRRTPKLFKLLSSRSQRMFRRFLEPRADRRPKNLADLTKFLDDRWLAKTAEKEMAEYETDELCPSMYSFHSSPDEKHRLLYTLADCGIETNVDRQSKKNRIKDWIESSIITEEDEEENEESASASPSSSVSREPVAGHISSIRQTIDKSKEIKSTLKDATQKHFDPRTGALQQGPSEMGATIPTHEKSLSPSMSNMSTVNNDDSLCGSLLTLGSHQDLMISNLPTYNSDINLSRLGEQEYRGISGNGGFFNQSLNSLLIAEEPPNMRRVNTSTGFGVKPAATTAAMGNNLNRPINKMQRTKSDSLRTASSPAIDNLAYNQNNINPAQQLDMRGTAPNGSSFFVNTMGNASFLTQQQISNNNIKPLNQFVGPFNASQALAQFALPAATASVLQQSQQKQSKDPVQQSQYFNRKNNDTQVKDSAYGSIDVSESPSKTLGKTQELNGTAMRQPPQPQVQQNMPNVRVQSTQQQRSYGGARTSSMKDTAYDRVVITNNGKKRR